MFKKFLLLISIMYTTHIVAGNILTQPVIVPDSIHELLVNSYGQDIDRKFAYCPVYNILYPNNKRWGNGIYRYWIQGNHLPTKLCIYYNDQLYIFNNEGWLYSADIITEFGKCVKEMNINNNDVVRFLKGLYIYLDEEKDMDYGITIK